MTQNPIRNLKETVLSTGWTVLSRYDFEFQHRHGAWLTTQREVYKRGAAVVILPYDRQHKTVLLTRQLRLPPFVHDGTLMLIEACAGLIDAGETPEAAILREAQEELGVTLDTVSLLSRAFSSPGNSCEELYLFLGSYNAQGRTNSGGGLVDEGEDIEVLEMPLQQAITLAEQGDIIDLKTIHLLYRCRELNRS